MNKQIGKYIKDGENYYNFRVDKEIERNRKGNFEIVFIAENGELSKQDIRLDVELKKIDFNFGANIFMLGEYDTDAENKRYEEKFTKLFNSAAVPLYWEGTEPKQGYLRYSKDIPNDVYRRPPADKVVEFCLENNIEMKGHPLFWHEFVPRWLPDNYQELKKLIVKRFEEISERYADIIPAFDVVNEPSRIYDCYMRDRYSGRKLIVPGDDYCLWIFKLAEKYFPTNKLILNDATGASFTEFRGKYSGYYLNIKELLNRGARIDEIGMQCHLGWNSEGENVYNAERLYNILDTYATLGRTINISEISIPSECGGTVDLELQAEAAERLYKTAFSHQAVTGITWWNMPDDGILTTKRVAGNENMPSAGLVDGGYNEKPAYKKLHHLINEEWTTKEKIVTKNGIASFRGFYGVYDISIEIDGKKIKSEADLRKTTSNPLKIFV